MKKGLPSVSRREGVAERPTPASSRSSPAAVHAEQARRARVLEALELDPDHARFDVQPRPRGR